MGAWARAEVLAAAWAAAALCVAPARAYDAAQASAAACLPQRCLASWDAWGRKTAPDAGGALTLPCDVASGHLPLGGFALPPVFQGQYELCKTFEAAHFCTIATSTPILLPLLNASGQPAGGFPLGNFRLDQCVSRECDLPALKASFFAQVERTVRALLRLAHASNATAEGVEAAVALLEKSVSVSCVAAPLAFDAVGVLTLVLLGGFLLAGVAGTVVSVYLSWSAAATGRLAGWFAMDRNFERLVASIPGDFNVLNGIRTISMFWVIIGHTVLWYAENIINPTAQAAATQSLWFTLIRGGEYAVDTFFFLSAFLAAWGVLGQLKKKRLTARTYALFLFGRYVRLTPTYLLTVLVFWKVLPATMEGPNWASKLKGIQACDEKFVYNVFYVNNLFPWGHTGTSEECAGWTWYLANDVS
jgi:hypothetical protein